MGKYLTIPPTFGYYKFVCVNGEYRFIEAQENMWASHKDCITEGEIASTAGTIGIQKDHWTVYDVSSMSLKVGMTETDYHRITELLGKPYKSRY